MRGTCADIKVAHAFGHVEQQLCVVRALLQDAARQRRRSRIAGRSCDLQKGAF